MECWQTAGRKGRLDSRKVLLETGRESSREARAARLATVVGAEGRTSTQGTSGQDV